MSSANFYTEHLFTFNVIEKMKIQRIEAGNGPCLQPVVHLVKQNQFKQVHIHFEFIPGPDPINKNLHYSHLKYSNWWKFSNRRLIGMLKFNKVKCYAKNVLQDNKSRRQCHKQT